MSNKDRIEVTFQAGRGLFKKAIGTHVGDDGKPRSTLWWLGRDRSRAIEHVRLILHAQEQLRAEGAMETHWTPEALIRTRRATARFDSRFQAACNQLK